MQKNQFTIGEKVNYTNGSPTIQNGTVKAVTEDGTRATIINEADKALVELRNAGYNVGDYIHISQVISIITF